MWRRWGMLGVYMGICAANGMVWSTFSSISTHATEYYDTSLDFINWFEMCFFISYFPPAPFVSWMMGRHLHWSMLACTFMTFLGCWTKYLAGNNINIAFIGQMIVAIMNSPVLSACSAVTAQWFPSHEQPVATTLSSLSNFIGIGVQFIMSPLIDDIPTILLVHACLSSIVLILSAFSIRRSPYPYIPKQFIQNSKMSWIKDKTLMSIMLSSGAIIGVGYAVLGILLQILSPSGYDALFTGYVGMIIVASGTLGGYIATKLIENEKYIKTTVWVYLGMSVVSSLLCAAFVDNKICGMVFAFFVGFSIIGFTPLGLKMSVMKSNDLEESIPANVIFGSAQIFSLGVTYPLEYFYDGVGATGLWCVPILVIIAYSIFVFASQHKKETGVLDGIYNHEELVVVNEHKKCIL